MRNNRPSRRSARNLFSRLFSGPQSSGVARKAPRRRDVERLEERQMMAVVGTPTNEPYFFAQWHLLANGQLVEQPNSPTYTQSRATTDINVVPAWNLGFSGAGVNVGVVDGGFDLNHEDLGLRSAQNPNGAFVLLVGDNGEFLDLLDADNLPGFIDTTDAHGTAVASLIGSRDNGVGMVGVAYNSNLIPVRLIPGNGDIPTGSFTVDPFALAYLQFAGIPSPGDDYFANRANIIDVFNRSYGPNDFDGRAASPLSADEARAFQDAATLGRGTWLDLNGNGIFEPSEIRALGSINLVAAGNGAGAGFIDPFNSIGVYDSSQYDATANSRFTIAVGAIDFDGSYTNLATGARGSFAETGTNVLIVAPSNAAAPETIGFVGGPAGVWSADISGEDGFNGPPIFGVEFDDDFFVDTNYTSTFGGTSASTPITTGVVALMLEANPRLSYRDVQQILLMSARQVDQFDESWVVNGYKFFEDIYEVPNYLYHDLDTNGDGDADVENAIIPNYTNPNYVRGFFGPASPLAPFLTPDMDVPAASAAIVNATAQGVISLSGEPDPIFVWPVDFDPDNLDGSAYLAFPVAGVNKGVRPNGINTDLTDTGIGFGTATSPVVNGELRFENGVGFTVSHGYGDYLEEYGYAHGLVDAELAVKLALAWEEYDLYLTEEITITTAIDGGSAPIRAQARADVSLGNGLLNFEVPGGLTGTANDPINTAWYEQWAEDFGWENIQNAAGDDIGAVITSGPWYNPEGELNGLLNTGSNRGDSRLNIRIDPAIAEDFLSVEWIEFTTQIVAGDIDALRITVVSPDGTHSELNPFRLQIDGTGEIQQGSQLQQGRAVPGDELLGEDFGGFTAADFIDGSERTLISEVDLDDAVPAGTSWTWTTNRHWGELFSSNAQNFDNPNNSVEGQWYIVIENWGNTPVDFGGQFEVSLHGTRATGNRIQGKIGVDDNLQGRPGQDGDEVFNFNRNITFGEISIDGVVQTVVLDDRTDSVFYNNNYYETFDPATGNAFRNAVIDKLEYEAYAEVLRGLISAPGTDLDFYVTLGSAIPAISTEEATAWFEVYGERLGLAIDVNGDMATDETDALAWQADLAARLSADLAAAEAFAPILDFNLVPGTSVLVAQTDSVGNAYSYQNWDYNQESFARNVTVQATQYRVDYDSAGVAIGRTATGVVDYFTTGADGNYWFDVVATPEAPRASSFQTTAAYQQALANWVDDFGFTFDYEISVVGSAAQSRVIDRSYASQVDLPRTEQYPVQAFGDGGQFPAGTLPVELGGGSINYQTGQLKYNVSIFASPHLADGQATVIRDVNFLLEVDPALTNVPTSGIVFRDRNGDGVQQAGLEESQAGVTVFHDANLNGTREAGEAFGVTDATGAYSLIIAGLSSQQNASIRIDTSTIDPTLELLNPVTGARQVLVTPGRPAIANFTLRRIGGEPAQVVGVVFEDVNQNGVRDNGEVGFADTLPVRVYIDLNGNSVLDSGEPVDETDATGQFLIESDQTGTFFVRIVTPSAQITQTTPTGGAGVSVTLVAGQSANLGNAFGVFDGRIFDFGDLYVDATHNFPTLAINDGASHVVIPGIRLGANIDIDTDGFQSPVRNTLIDGLGDDFDGVDDEDGVRLVTQVIVPNSTIEFDITAFGAGAVLNAWIDFNNNGNWDDPGEKIFNNVEDLQVLNPSNPLARRISAPTPAAVDTSADFYAARFRWGPAGIGYDGVANAGEVEDYLFAAIPPIVVNGAVRNDLDGDAIFEGTDSALAGVRVFFDRDLDGVLDANEPRALTDTNGAYRLEINTETALNVTLRLDLSTLPSGIDPLVPVDGIFSQIVSPSALVTANYLVAAPQGVTGVVFNDLDNDGVRDGGEGGFGALLVEVLRDADGNGSFETVVNSTLTSASGAYNLPISAVGNYQVRVNLAGRQFVTQSLPAGGVGRTVSVSAGAFATVGDFGVHDAVPTFTLDYGDLIDDATRNFPTTLADNGARHTRVSGSFLGLVAPDADPGTQQSANATADDNLFGDDEDGVVMASSVVAGSNVLIDVRATGSAADRLHAWIDFNNDGDWLDAGEQITAVGGVALTSGATTRLVVDTAGIAIDGAAAGYAARFRWGQGITGFTGLASTGEVEDYILPRVLGTSGGVLDADFNGDGSVDLLDLDILGGNFGAGPGATASQGDANGDGNIDLLDLDILGSEFGSSSSASFAALTDVNGDDSVDLLDLDMMGAQAGTLNFALATAGADESVSLAPLVLEASVFGPMLLPTVAAASAIDESLAVDDESIVADDAVDAALLQLALASADEEESDEESCYCLGGVEAEEDEEVLSLALAF